MHHKPFIFKHFIVEQDLCAMKVGTDAMILGSYVVPGNARRILDIGTGSGVLALMLAQRSRADIDSIDSNEQAYTQAKQNFKNSSWNFRMKTFYGNIQDFIPYKDFQYDLIISNPPYFKLNLKAAKESSKYDDRRHARSFDNLNFEDLLTSAARLLAEKGRFFIIMPAYMMDKFTRMAGEHGLFLFNQLLIRSKENHSPVRCILGLHRQRTGVEENHLIVYENGGNYTNEYIKLTKDFHAIDLSKRKK